MFVGFLDFITLLKNSIKVNKVVYLEDTQVLKVELENISSSDLLFENAMSYNFYSKSPVFTIAAGQTETLQIKTLEKLPSIDLKLKALGAFTAPKEQPIIEWKIVVE